MMRSRITGVVLAAMLALAAPAMPLAQPSGTTPDQAADQAPAWRWGPGAMMDWFSGMMGDWDAFRGPMMGRGWPGHGMMHGPARFIDGRIAFLEAELRITGEQKPLFDAFATALRDAAAGMEPMHRRMLSRDVPENLPDRLQWHIDETSARLQSMETVRAAAVPLYEALTSDQKVLADQLVGPMGMF